ncbi:MAG TPA: single-stranded DNA-binding protein [Desulfobacteraceae bacterium]|nr:single-stranded DNA-binding protein [Desulfobacteraceae bacterium]
MSGINKVMIIGRVGRDPETNYTPAGLAITKFSIATSEEWNSKSTGDKNEKTEWHRIVAFGKPAEILGKYLRKGSQVYIEGRLQTSSWEKDGIKRYSTDIVVNNFQFLGGKRRERSQQPEPNFGGQNDDGFDTGDSIPF